jgi:hypothetical protein
VRSIQLQYQAHKERRLQALKGEQSEAKKAIIDMGGCGASSASVVIRQLFENHRGSNILNISELVTSSLLLNRFSETSSLLVSL